MMLMPEIPEAEWWDKPFLQGYPQEDADSTKTIEVKNGKGYGTEFEEIPILESAVNSYIVRPRPILPPNEKSKGEPQELQLTRKERRKLIRINRSNKRKEEREAILLGIKEAPKPRVRIANMMRVHGTEAMQDPTLLETIVRKEMREREQRHDERNQERKLTPEQRKEKNRRKYLEDTSLCTYVSIFKVFKVQDDTSKLPKKKIEMNATQFLLSGCCLITPNFTVVIVEGGIKALRKFKKLMIKRIKWEDINIGEDKKNYCQLVWEGEVLKPSFTDFQMKKNKHSLHHRKFLVDRGCAHYFDIARNYEEN